MLLLQFSISFLRAIQMRWVCMLWTFRKVFFQNCVTPQHWVDYSFFPRPVPIDSTTPYKRRELLAFSTLRRCNLTVKTEVFLKDFHFLILVAFAYHLITQRLQNWLQKQSLKRSKTVAKHALMSHASWKRFQNVFGTILESFTLVSIRDVFLAGLVGIRDQRHPWPKGRLLPFATSSPCAECDRK